MKAPLFIIASVVVAYFVLKLYLYIYRPFVLSKAFREIDNMYNNLLDAVGKDVNSAIEDYRKWQSGDKVLRDLRTEEEIIKSVDTAKGAKIHEEELHDKFLQVRERFIGDHKKLSEGIVAYRRYLGVKLKQHRDASLFANAVTSGAVSFDEMVAAARETIVVLEENKKKLDVLLTYEGNGVKS